MQMQGVQEKMSVIIWKGESQYDNSPIMLLATGEDNPSSNIKTGAMIQVWILRTDMPPVEAVKKNLDGAVCGECAMRWNNGGGCYVIPFHYSVMWKKAVTTALHITPQKLAALARKKHLPIRMGAYGDPAMVPLWVWEQMGGMPKGSGYTHQWETADPKYATWLMASVETLEKKEEANKLGYRTFRILNKAADLAADEVMCPNYTRGTQCRTCGLCGGLRSKAKNVAIPMH